MQQLDERERLLAALLSTNWNKTRAAEQLHWSRMTLYRKLHKYAIKAAEI
jgi:transcriptional regulator of acetoin/glycerol metabolism